MSTWINTLIALPPAVLQSLMDDVVSDELIDFIRKPDVTQDIYRYVAIYDAVNIYKAICTPPAGCIHRRKLFLASIVENDSRKVYAVVSNEAWFKNHEEMTTRLAVECDRPNMVDVKLCNEGIIRWAIKNSSAVVLFKLLPRLEPSNVFRIAVRDGSMDIAREIFDRVNLSSDCLEICIEYRNMKMFKHVFCPSRLLPSTIKLLYDRCLGGCEVALQQVRFIRENIMNYGMWTNETWLSDLKSSDAAFANFAIRLIDHESCDIIESVDVISYLQPDVMQFTPFALYNKEKLDQFVEYAIVGEKWSAVRNLSTIHAPNLSKAAVSKCISNGMIEYVKPTYENIMSCISDYENMSKLLKKLDGVSSGDTADEPNCRQDAARLTPEQQFQCVVSAKDPAIRSIVIKTFANTICMDTLIHFISTRDDAETLQEHIELIPAASLRKYFVQTMISAPKCNAVIASRMEKDDVRVLSMVIDTFTK